MRLTSASLEIFRYPVSAASILGGALRGHRFSRRFSVQAAAPGSPTGTDLPEPRNPLRDYFEANKVGPGIWKWNHYFDVYHRHFARFIGREVNILEIGIYSGGSLGMWKSYFGPRSRIYGVDIEEACRIYEGDRVKVFIGDQGSREFWKRFRAEAPTIDILIDDGGHQPEQQIVTLEEMLPHLRPGGVYLCEDIHGDANLFNSYLSGLAAHVNAFHSHATTPEDGISSTPTPFQAAIDSMHLYPFIAVIEKALRPTASFHAPRRGTEFQPFYDVVTVKPAAAKV